MLSAPVVAYVFEGEEGLINNIKKIVGPTKAAILKNENPELRNTIRSKYAIDGSKTLYTHRIILMLPMKKSQDFLAKIIVCRCKSIIALKRKKKNIEVVSIFFFIVIMKNILLLFNFFF